MEKIYIAIPLDRTDSITMFYDKVAKELGFDPEFITMYDPGKVWVSDERAQDFERVYGSEFTYVWASFGPRVDDALKKEVVLVEEGFVKEVEQ